MTTILATAITAKEAGQIASTLASKSIGTGRGIIGWEKNGTSGIYEIRHHALNKPGVDTSCVACGLQHRTGCLATKWAVEVAV